jgi:hypothetical protein
MASILDSLTEMTDQVRPHIEEMAFSLLGSDIVREKSMIRAVEDWDEFWASAEGEWLEKHGYGIELHHQGRLVLLVKDGATLTEINSVEELRKITQQLAAAEQPSLLLLDEIVRRNQYLAEKEDEKRWSKRSSRLSPSQRSRFSR